MRKRAITIREVANDAEVSIATVSRVLNEPSRVQSETRDSVNASIAKLGYVPNIRARLLARGNSGTICFLLSNQPFAHSIHGQVLQGAAKKADALGIQVVFTSCYYDADTPSEEIKLPNLLTSSGFLDGVVMAGTNYPNIIEALGSLELPFIIHGTNMAYDDVVPHQNTVYIDSAYGGYLAARHLISHGHTAIRFIGDVSLPWYLRRYNGFKRAMDEAGLPCPPAIGSAFNGELAMGYDATIELIDAWEKFTGLFVGGDIGAIGAMRALKKRGLSVPKDVSVVGFNDDESATIVDPQLTTIRGLNEEAGMKCVELLNSLIRDGNEPKEPAILQVTLVDRDSTAPPPKRKS